MNMGVKMDIVLKKLSNPKTYRNEKIIQFIINEINGIIMWDDIEIKLENNQPQIPGTHTAMPYPPSTSTASALPSGLPVPTEGIPAGYHRPA